MVDLEIGGLGRESSITRDVVWNAGFYAGVLGMRPVYKGANIEGPSMYPLACADGGSSTGREEGPTQEELGAVRRLGRRVAEKAALLVGRAHV
jgi:catechol 2,3-dioxygenase-like lactoylglutathione lyase family enzyme